MKNITIRHWIGTCMLICGHNVKVGHMPLGYALTDIDIKEAENLEMLLTRG